MKKDNVIDLNEKLQDQQLSPRTRNLRMKFEFENMKLAIATSLLSVVALVTLANNKLLSGPSHHDYAQGAHGVRGIASVPTGVSPAEDKLIERLSKMNLSETAAIGRRPSSIERLSLEVLEGKYAVLLHNGKIRGLEFANAPEQDDRPKHIEDRAEFLESHRDLLPVAFHRPVKVESHGEGTEMTETYQLVNSESQPVARVRFRMDSAGRLLSMRVAESRVVSK